MREAVSPPNKTAAKIIILCISVTWRKDMFCFEKIATDYSDRNCSLPPFSDTRNVAISNPHFASNVRTVQKQTSMQPAESLFKHFSNYSADPHVSTTNYFRSPPRSLSPYHYSHNTTFLLDENGSSYWCLVYPII
jgi:hypothetical protein